MPSALVDLSGSLGAGWAASTNVGYYVHRGTVYLAGTIASSFGAPAVTATLLTVPPAVRPATPVSVVLPIAPENTSDVANTVLELPISWPATLRPDGSLTLDAAPPDSLNHTPDPTYWFYVLNFPHDFPQYGSPLGVGLGIGNVRWPISSGSDDYELQSLAPYLGPDFDQIDAAYAVHRERVHLSGRVRARTNGATVLLESLPPGSDAGLGSRSLGARSSFTDANDAYVINLRDDAEVVGDYVVPTKPRDQDPPVSTYSPPSFSDDGFGFGNFITQDPTAYDDGATQEIGVIHDSYTIDHGYHLCDLGFGLGLTRCANTGPVPSFTFDIHDLLAQVRPVPQWFLLQLFFRVSTAGDHDGFPNWGKVGCKLPVSPTDLGDCGPEDPDSIPLGNAGFTLSGAGGLVSDLAGTPFGTEMVDMDGGSEGVWGTGGGGELIVAPPAPLYRGSMEFTGSSTKPAPSLWWRADQAGDITVGFEGTVGGDVQDRASSPASVVWYALIRPAFERRQIGLRAGEVLDLTGCGWPGTFAPAESPPGQITASFAPGGIRPRGGHRAK